MLTIPISARGMNCMDRSVFSALGHGPKIVSWLNRRLRSGNACDIPHSVKFTQDNCYLSISYVEKVSLTDVLHVRAHSLDRSPSFEMPRPARCYSNFSMAEFMSISTCWNHKWIFPPVFHQTTLHSRQVGNPWLFFRHWNRSSRKSRWQVVVELHSSSVTKLHESIKKSRVTSGVYARIISTCHSRLTL